MPPPDRPVREPGGLQVLGGDLRRAWDRPDRSLRRGLCATTRANKCLLHRGSR